MRLDGRECDRMRGEKDGHIITKVACMRGALGLKFEKLGRYRSEA